MTTDSARKVFDPFNARASLTVEGETFGYYKLSTLADKGIAPNLAKLPYSIRILLEAVLRNCDGFTVTSRSGTRLRPRRSSCRSSRRG